MAENNCDTCELDDGRCPLDAEFAKKNHAARWFSRTARRRMTPVTGCVLHVQDDGSRHVTVHLKNGGPKGL